MAKTTNQVLNTQPTGRKAYPVAASTHLYEGCAFFINSDGYAVGTTGSGANRFGGFAAREVDNSGGSAGDLWVTAIDACLVQVEGGTFAQTDVGGPCYATDNFTFTPTAAAGVHAGSIVQYVSSTKVWIDISQTMEGGDLDISLQTVTLVGATGVNVVSMTDNLASALDIKQGANSYLKFVTTNGSEAVVLGQNVTLTDGKTVANSANVTGTVLWGASDKGAFFGGTPATRPAAYTQTYSTADRTHAAATAATLTMTDGAGTNDNTIGAITADASVIAAFQEVVDEVNKLIADVLDVKQLCNALIDDHQALNLAG